MAPHQSSTSTVGTKGASTNRLGGRPPKTQKSKLRAALAAKEELQVELEKIYEKLKNPTSTRPEVPPETLYTAITSSLLKNNQAKSEYETKYFFVNESSIDVVFNLSESIFIPTGNYWHTFRKRRRFH